jgi:hypothetical protein
MSGLSIIMTLGSVRSENGVGQLLDGSGSDLLSLNELTCQNHFMT